MKNISLKTPFLFITYIINENMKRYCITLLKQIGLRLGIMAVAALMGGLIVLAVNLPFHDMIFITNSHDYFWFDGRRIACLSAVPLLIYCIVMSFFAIFSKTHRSPKKLDIFGDIFAISCMAFFILLNIATLFFYFYIMLFSPFKLCEMPELKNYYVINDKVCSKIDTHGFY